MAVASACGGGGAPPAEPTVPGAYFARIIATKRTTGSLVNFDVSDDYRAVYAAYGENGLVTMDISDLNDIRITRRIDDIRSSDVRACGTRLYSLDYQPPPFKSRIHSLDLSVDRTVPVRLGELQIDLGTGAGIACAGDDLIVSAGTLGLYRVTAPDLRFPEATFLGDPASLGVVAFYDLKALNSTQVIAAVELPPDPACFPIPPTPCNPTDPRLGRLGIRMVNVSNGRGTTDRRVPLSRAIDFPFISGINTSPINFPLAAVENSDLTLILSGSGRRFTVYRGNNVVSSDSFAGLPASDIADVESVGDLAVAADGDVRIVDLTDPAVPRVATSIITPGTAYTLKLRQLEDGSFHVYVADGENGFVVIGVEKVKPVFVEVEKVFNVTGSVADIGQMPPHVPTSPVLASALGQSNFLNGGLLVLSRSNGEVPIGDNIDRTDGNAANSINPVAEITGGSLYTTSAPRAGLPGTVRPVSRNAAGFLDFECWGNLNALLILRALPLIRIPASIDPLTGCVPAVPPYPDSTPLIDEQLGPLSPFHGPTGIAVQNDGYPFVVSSGANLNNVAQSEPIILSGRAASISPDGRPVTYVLENAADPSGPIVPAFPPRRGGPVTGVWWSAEDWRDCAQLPNTVLGFRLRSEVPGAPAGLPCGAEPGVPQGTSEALSWGLFGVVFGGIGVDNAQPDNPLTPVVDYYTRNPVYFAATGDGGIIQIDLDSGISQLAPPCTTLPLVPNAPCAATLPPGPLLPDDPSLKQGMLFDEETRTLFVADPARNFVQAVSLSKLEPATPQGVWYRSGGYTIEANGLFSMPIDLAPTNPPQKSPDHLRTSSDIYVLNRGTSSIVKVVQSGDLLEYIVPRVKEREFDAGTFTAIATSADGTTLYLAVENCPSAGESCIYSMPAP